MTLLTSACLCVALLFVCVVDLASSGERSFRYCFLFLHEHRSPLLSNCQIPPETPPVHYVLVVDKNG